MGLTPTLLVSNAEIYAIIIIRGISRVFDLLYFIVIDAIKVNIIDIVNMVVSPNIRRSKEIY